MSKSHSNDNTIKTNDSFVELFNLLKKVKEKNSSVSLDYDLPTIGKMLFHVDNAITGILHGLQSIGSFISISSEIGKDDILQIMYFIGIVSNLVEALHVLRLDCESELMPVAEKCCSC